MDRERKGIRTSNVLILLCCVALTLGTVLTSGDRIESGARVNLISFSMTLYLVAIAVSIFVRKHFTFAAGFVIMTVIYAGFIAAYASGSTMIFAVVAMFSAGVAYFNKERSVNLLHAIVNSALLIICSVPVNTGMFIDDFFAKLRQFEPIEVVSSIIGIIITDLFFIFLNTGRIRQQEILEEQERSTDELMRIIEAKADEARAATKSKSDFLASMSHEIRTPINSVLGMNEMILRETEEENTRKYAEDIQHAGNMLLSLVNNILDFSKIESGKMEIIPVKYDMGILISDIKIIIANRAMQKGLKFSVKVAPDMPRVLYGDEIRIKQIITNILTNAVKYTETGSVNFNVDFDKADERSVLLKVSISDTGRGMKEDDLNKLFSPFERIEELRNRHIEGTGLGMSIVQQLLALMGTRLNVKSVYGKGSTFEFVIRQEVVDWTQVGDMGSIVSVSRTKRVDTEQFTAPLAKILVVDDIKMNLNVIVGLLKRTKIQVDTALSGAEAIDMARKKEYDILFIDHMMPEMDGIETLEKIKKDRFALCREKPMIALTANAISGAREFYLKKGFVGYLSKPVDPKLLEKIIIEFLPEELIATGAKRIEED
ncbi:MAG: response regulator [Lachnospiraceae bacterium]|nr:response regulator [Lachnospiraceae bacterium]MBR6302458.1 response regulator [Lachnospiraceae bacterium]